MKATLQGVQYCSVVNCCTHDERVVTKNPTQNPTMFEGRQTQQARFFLIKSIEPARKQQEATVETVCDVKNERVVLEQCSLVHTSPTQMANWKEKSSATSVRGFYHTTTTTVAKIA